MISVRRFFLLIAAASLLLYAGCEIETEADRGVSDNPAGSLVINEVFTLSFTEPTRFNWIEFLNAGNDTVDLNGWTLEYTTPRLRTNVRVAIFPNGDWRLLQVFPSVFDAYGRFRVPFASTSPPNGPPSAVARKPLPPRGLMTVVDNESRMNDVTGWGPGNTRWEFEAPAFYDTVDIVDTLLFVPDSVTVLLGGFNAYAFLLDTTEQLVLRNPAGQVVDVVRYGNFQPPSPDPYPGNQSQGLLPPFESIYRFAGGYKTNLPWGNTLNDFDVTRADVRPVPQWYSQPHKR